MSLQEDAERPGAKILVVDDNEANRLLARDTLEDEGYSVVLAAGGAEGIAAFQSEQPDCVLLDVRMPDLDGFAVCQRIQSLPRGAETPVLFLTALRDIDTFDRAVGVGGIDFLTKPIRPGELAIRVRTALEMRRVHAELAGSYTMLKKQRDDLLRLQLQKERVTAFLVHDLKNPVNTLDLHAQVLLRRPELSAIARESVVHIRTEARHLNRLVLNLLDIAKADEGQLVARPSEVNLGTLVDDVLGELELNATSRRVVLRSALESKRVWADADLLRRTLGNLVENAIRHAPRETLVVVASAGREAAVEIRVADAGPGIPVEMRQKIFDAFVQLNPGERSAGSQGRGLGLTFCKFAAQAHGGQLWVEDAAPGAVFCLRLPDGR